MEEKEDMMQNTDLTGNDTETSDEEESESSSSSSMDSEESSSSDERGAKAKSYKAALETPVEDVRRSYTDAKTQRRTAYEESQDHQIRTTHNTLKHLQWKYGQ